MRSRIKKILMMIIILVLLFSINIKVYGWSEIIEDAQDWLKEAKPGEGGTPKDYNSLQNLSKYLYNILLAAGIIIAVIVATVLGVQFIIGGAEGQAKVKETLIPFLVGCIIVFGGFGIWKIAVNIGQQLDTKASMENIIDEN